jgi:hypothetical protein
MWTVQITIRVGMRRWTWTSLFENALKLYWFEKETYQKGKKGKHSTNGDIWKMKETLIKVMQRNILRWAKPDKRNTKAFFVGVTHASIFTVVNSIKLQVVGCI